MFYIAAFCAVERVEDAVKDENTNALFKALTSPVLGLKVCPLVSILDLWMVFHYSVNISI